MMPASDRTVVAGMTRKIIHIDMDAFYASVEQRDDPTLRGRPVVVGGSPNGRGVVAAASYEARRFGIRSATPASRAIRLCPDAVFIRPRFDVYRTESKHLQAIFRRYTPRVEPLSLDEAYLDVSDSEAHDGSATRIAREIKHSILSETGLVASAGVSYNKFLAKQASDMDKPDGLYVITPEAGPKFVAELPVGHFHGVGKATESRMHALGIRTGADLTQWALDELQAEFGKRGPFYYYIARGIDERPVQPIRQRKSIGAETTFAHDLTRREDMLDALQPLGEEVLGRLEQRQLTADTFTIKVKYHDFSLITRSHTEPGRAMALETLMQVLDFLLERTEVDHKPVRLLGVTASRLRQRTRIGKQMVFDW